MKDIKMKFFSCLQKSLQPAIVALLAMTGPHASGLDIGVMGFIVESENNKIEVFDANGKPTAMIKVVLPENVTAVFEGNIVTKASMPREYTIVGSYDSGRSDTIKQKMEEHYIFMSEGSKFIRVKVPGYDPTLVVFKDHGIDKLVSNTAYNLPLSVLTDVLTDSQRISLIASEGKDLYFKGDYFAAVPRLREAAQAGNDEALNLLGLCYYYGRGVVKDYKKAAQYYRQASDKGNDAASLNLGSCYYNGEGVPQDGAEAVRLYKKSASKGNGSAYYNLGYCSELGIGVPQDFQQALNYYVEAEKLGDKESHDKIIEIKKFVGK